MSKENILFSICIPSIPSRLDRLCRLLNKLLAQAEDYPEVEILSWIDNCKRSIGYKRDDLIRMAAGKYVTVTDDDDDVASDYVETIVATLRANPDVDLVCFDQEASIDGESFVVHFGLGNKNEQAQQVRGKWRDIRRGPWYCCVWRASIARRGHFPNISYGEDWRWSQQIIPYVKREVRIPKVLHKYQWSTHVTEAYA